MFTDTLGHPTLHTYPGAGFYQVYPPTTFTLGAAAFYQDPSGTPWWEHDYVGGPSSTPGNPGVLAGKARISQRHFEGANVAYVDGHVKYSKLPGVLTENDNMWKIQ